MPSEEIERGLALLEADPTMPIAVAARNAGCKRPRLSEAWARRKAEGSEEGMVTTSKPGELPPEWTPEALAEYYGVDLDQWVADQIIGNLWGDPGDPRNQLKVRWKAASAVLRPADPGSWTPPPKPKPRKATKNRPEKVLLCADLHAPLEEERLCEMLFEVLAEEKPDRAKLLGDGIDFERVSRHAPREKPKATNEGIQAGHNFFRSARQANPDTAWEFIPGNHDWRINSYTMSQAPELYGLCAANDDVPAHHLRRLLLLDELGVKWTQDAQGDWETTHIVLSPLLAATHKAGGGKNAANSALDSYDHSIAQGDTHRLQLVYKTKHEFNVAHEPEITTRASIQVGCLCSREAAFYSKRPNFQQGFVMAYIWPDGKFHVEPYIYVRGELFGPGGRRYS